MAWVLSMPSAIQPSRKPTMTLPFTSFRHLALAAVTTFACLTSALAAQPNSSDPALARYRHDLALCNSGQSNQTPATCRREANSALAEARKGNLVNAPDQYQQNALRRCQDHTGDDRQACEARILGQGDVSRGTQAGGLLRESVTVTPAQ
jgi:hypothetical protein